jgi:hypothetical protein
MIARLVDLLPISFDKFAAVSGTLLDRDSAIVRTWQSATRPQPTSAQDRMGPLGSVGRPTAGGPRSSTSLAANMPSDKDPFTLARLQSDLCETEPPPGPHRRPDPLSSPLKAELALWRAFLGDEIDAILRDKD